jgi:hypothetical protein
MSTDGVIGTHDPKDGDTMFKDGEKFWLNGEQRTYVAQSALGKPCYCVGPKPGHALCPCFEEACGVAPIIEETDMQIGALPEGIVLDEITDLTEFEAGEIALEDKRMAARELCNNIIDSLEELRRLI